MADEQDHPTHLTPTPAQQLGYRVGDRFFVTDDVMEPSQTDRHGEPMEGDTYLPTDTLDAQPMPGSIVQLVDDDGDNEPWFRVVVGFNRHGQDLSGRALPLRISGPADVVPMESNVGPEGQCEATDTQTTYTREADHERE